MSRNIHRNRNSVSYRCLVADYVPVGGSRFFPCFPVDVEQHNPTGNGAATAAAALRRLPELTANVKSVEMQWLNDEGVEMTASNGSSNDGDSGASRIRLVDSRANLTLSDATPENTGRYQCVATATVANGSRINVVNELRINGDRI